MRNAKHHCETCGSDEAEAEFVRFGGYIQAIVYTCLLCSTTDLAA